MGAAAAELCGRDSPPPAEGLASLLCGPRTVLGPCGEGVLGYKAGPGTQGRGRALIPGSCSLGDVVCVSQKPSRDSEPVSGTAR